jgi:hypothetical protein
LSNTVQLWIAKTAGGEIIPTPIASGIIDKLPDDPGYLKYFLSLISHSEAYGWRPRVRNGSVVVGPYLDEIGWKTDSGVSRNLPRREQQAGAQLGNNVDMK